MSHQVKTPTPIFDKIFLGFLGFLGNIVGLLKGLSVLAVVLGILGYMIAVAREEFRVDYFFKPTETTKVEQPNR